MTTSAGERLSVPVFLNDEKQHRRMMGVWIQQANQGHLNNAGTVTLTVNAQSTSVADARAGRFSFIGFMPTTGNAASEMAAGTMFVSTRLAEGFVITHASAVAADRTFVYAILG